MNMSRMEKLRITFLLLVFMTGLVIPQNVFWIYPPAAGRAHDFKDNLLMHIGSRQTLRWSTQLPNSQLSLFQELVGAGAVLAMNITDNTQGQEYEWIVDRGRDATVSPVFYLGVTVSYKDRRNSTFESSHYFNITDEEVISSSSVGTANTPSQTSSIASVTVSMTSKTDTASTKTGTPPPGVVDPDQRTCISIGAAVGIAIAGTAAILIAMFWGCRWWLSRNNDRIAVPTTTNIAAQDENLAERHALAELEAGTRHKTPIGELPGDLESKLLEYKKNLTKVKDPNQAFRESFRGLIRLAAMTSKF